MIFLRKKIYFFLGKYNPVVGYTGHIRRVASDNLFGIGYEKSLGDSLASLDNLKRWKLREIQIGDIGLPAIKKGKRQKKRLEK